MTLKYQERRQTFSTSDPPLPHSRYLRSQRPLPCPPRYRPGPSSLELIHAIVSATGCLVPPTFTPGLCPSPEDPASPPGLKNYDSVKDSVGLAKGSTLSPPTQPHQTNLQTR
ncbi:unnamed protein product [Coregonus sp. 'balchen']|nr:unnamed protein product [Coregonus sp. 'balchen']